MLATNRERSPSPFGMVSGPTPKADPKSIAEVREILASLDAGTLRTLLAIQEHRAKVERLQEVAERELNAIEDAERWGKDAGAERRTAIIGLIEQWMAEHR